MGCCFSTEIGGEPSSSSNLLRGTQRKYVEENGSGAPSVSARLHRPPRERQSEHNDLQVSKMKPIAIDEIQKTFQDHERLYEDLLHEYNVMLIDMHSFKSVYEAETCGIPELPKCVQILVGKCGDTKLDVKRRKHCVQVEFSEQIVLSNALRDPQEVIDSLNMFNSINKHMEKVLDRTQGFQDSIDSIVSDENKLRLQVTKASLTASEGTKAIRNLIENVKVLRKMRINLKTMKTKCDETFKDILESSKGFFQSF